MTVIAKVTFTVHCNWPGCERACPSPEMTSWRARTGAQGQGWNAAVGLDFCPLHPRHEAAVDDNGLLTGCATCGGVQEAATGPEDAQERWIAHLPELLSAPTSLGDGVNRRRGALVPLGEEG